MAIQDTVRAWLRLFRAHTAILEAPLAMLGAGLALGTLWKPVIALWAVFGIIYHFVGYGMNSYVDWKKGFDKDDPRKQHHPLNTGEITPEAAKKAIIVGMGILILYGLVLGRFSIVAIGSVGVMVISGVAYNYFGKYTDFKFIPISIVHTMVFVYPYLQYSGSIQFGGANVDSVFILMAAAYFVHHSFQIMISGDVKDIDQDEASLIKRMGADIDYGIVHDEGFTPGKVVLMVSYLLMIIQIGLATAAGVVAEGMNAYLLFIIPLGFWMLYEGDKVVQGGAFNREERVTHMSRKELAGYLMIHSSTIPVLGLEAFLVVAVFMFGYLFTTSKFMWGNWVRPEV